MKMRSYDQSYKSIYAKFAKNKNCYLKERINLDKAYKRLKEIRDTWSSRYSLYHKILAPEQVDCLSVDEVFEIFKTQLKKSLEPLAYLDTNDLNTPFLLHHGHIKRIPQFSFADWPKLCKELGDTIYLTVGYRKGFFTHNPLSIYHSILLVSDGEKQYAVFGYNKPKKHELGLNNDLKNEISHHYTFYDELTIRGSARQLTALFANIEKYGRKLHYDFVKNNCYSALIIGLLDAPKLGFEIPQQFKERLLITIAKELNLGLGTLTNHTLSPLIGHACEEINKPQMAKC